MTSTRAAVHKDVLDLNSKDTSEVMICEMKDLSLRIKHLKLDVYNKELTFKAGQFVDFHVPGLTALTGFSMCSSPQMLDEQRKMELAVQDSDHPTPRWVHTQCQVGSKVKVRVNGDFFLEVNPSEPMHAILVAGGIGINPILSMLLYTTKLVRDHESVNNIKVTVMYSARSMQELVFKDVMDEVAKRHSDIVKMHYFITRESIPPTSGDEEASNITLHAGRITEDSIKSILEDSSDSASNSSYVCGPSSMIETIVAYLNNAGLPKEQIHYEKWW